MSDKVTVYRFATGNSFEFQPMVTLKGFEIVEEKDNKRFHELMHELQHECLKLKIHFAGEIYELENKQRSITTLNFSTGEPNQINLIKTKL